MATAWTAYFPEVMPHVGGCPHAMVVNAIRDAAREFAERTLLLRSTLSAINVVAAQQDYTLTPPANTRVVTCLNVRYDGLPLQSTGEHAMDHIHPFWREGGVSRRWYMSTPGTLSLTFSPAAAITGGLVVRIAYKPTQTATDGDDILYDDWNEAIAAGALARLQGTANQDAKWANPQMAQAWQAEFERGIHDGAVRARMGHGNHAPVMNHRPW